MVKSADVIVEVDKPSEYIEDEVCRLGVGTVGRKEGNVVDVNRLPDKSEDGL